MEQISPGDKRRYAFMGPIFIWHMLGKKPDMQALFVAFAEDPRYNASNSLRVKKGGINLHLAGTTHKSPGRIGWYLNILFDQHL